MSDKLPSRRSIRLRGYDYSQQGLYFVTICTHQHQCLFGEFCDGEMISNPHRQIVTDCWIQTERIRPQITLGEFVVMPNHFHAVFAINDISNNDTAIRRGDLPVARVDKSYEHLMQDNRIVTSNHIVAGDRQVAPTGPKQGSVGAIIAGFKSMVTVRINQLRNTPQSPVWQRNYHEHIIRNDHALHKISQYIIENPARWQNDCFYK